MLFMVSVVRDFYFPLVAMFYFGHLRCLPDPALNVLCKIKVYWSLAEQTCIVLRLLSLNDLKMASKQQHYCLSE